MGSVTTRNICPGCFRPKGTVEKCPHCGYETSVKRDAKLLPWWTLLRGRYLIGRELGRPWPHRYLAWDKMENKPVVVSEYDAKEAASSFYAELAYESMLKVDWDSAYESFIEDFLGTMDKLARLDNLFLERVREAFSVNYKAYAVGDYMPGMSLADYLARAGGPIPEDRAVAVMLPILDALCGLQAAGLDCDVYKETIFLADWKRPVLLSSSVSRRGWHPGHVAWLCANLLGRMVAGIQLPETGWNQSLESARRQALRDLPPGVSLSPGLIAALADPGDNAAAFRRALRAVRDGGQTAGHLPSF